MKRQVSRGFFLFALLATAWFCAGRTVVAQRNPTGLGRSKVKCFFEKLSDLYEWNKRKRTRALAVKSSVLTCVLDEPFLWSLGIVLTLDEQGLVS